MTAKHTCGSVWNPPPAATTYSSDQAAIVVPYYIMHALITLAPAPSRISKQLRSRTTRWCCRHDVNQTMYKRGIHHGQRTQGDWQVSR